MMEALKPLGREMAARLVEALGTRRASRRTAGRADRPGRRARARRALAPVRAAGHAQPPRGLARDRAVDDEISPAGASIDVDPPPASPPTCAATSIRSRFASPTRRTDEMLLVIAMTTVHGRTSASADCGQTRCGVRWAALGSGDDGDGRHRHDRCIQGEPGNHDTEVMMTNMQRREFVHRVGAAGLPERRRDAARVRGGVDQARRRNGPARHRRAELLPARRLPRGEGRRQGHPGDQPHRCRLRERDPDPGLAHGGPRLLRLRHAGQEALRDDQAALRRPGAVARPLRAGHATTRRCTRT